jgi:hypothetical protein
MKLNIKKAVVVPIKNIADHFNQYDAIVLVGLLALVLVPDSWQAFMAGVTVYGMISSIVKNARPDITLIVAEEKKVVGGKIVE